MSARIFVPFVAGSVFTAAIVFLGIGVSQAQQPPAQVAAQTMVAAPAQVAPQPVVTPMPAQPHPMFQGEQALDTGGGDATLVGAKGPLAPRSRVRTPSDENLPKWVPVRGRLTVVESSDLAENLGLVPRGATKKSAERISAQDKLEEEAAARASQASAAPQGHVFSVKSHIGHRR